MRPPAATGRLLIIFAVTLLVSGALLALAQDSDNPPPPLMDTITYTIRPNDVLDTIAARYDVSVDCLIGDNGIERPNRILAGDTLTISVDCPFYFGPGAVLNPRPGHDLSVPVIVPAEVAATSIPVDANLQQTYVVQMNDTLDTIAQKFNISVQVLSGANGNPKPNRLNIGQTLIIPINGPVYGVYLPVNTGTDQGVSEPSVSEMVYIVQPGDVLDLIASAFNLQRQCIVDRNRLKKPLAIFPGQTLILPSDCPPYDGPSLAWTPNAGGIQNSGSGPVATPGAPATPLAQISPTPEQLAQPTAAPPAVTPEAVG